MPSSRTLAVEGKHTETTTLPSDALGRQPWQPAEMAQFPSPEQGGPLYSSVWPSQRTRSPTKPMLCGTFFSYVLGDSRPVRHTQPDSVGTRVEQYLRPLELDCTGGCRT
jgi:hypothetical protein